MISRYNIICGCECFISFKSIHLSLLTWRDPHLKHLKDRSCNVKNRRSSEISSHIFETYNNAVQSHGCSIYNTAADMSIRYYRPWCWRISIRQIVCWMFECYWQNNYVNFNVNCATAWFSRLWLKNGNA